MSALTLYSLTQRRILRRLQAGGEPAVLAEAVAWLISHYATTSGVLSKEQRAALQGYAEGVQVGLASSVRVVANALGVFEPVVPLLPAPARLWPELEAALALLSYLETVFGRRQDLQRTLHGLVLTHPHVDHTRGVPAVLAKYRVLNAATNGQKGGGVPGTSNLRSSSPSPMPRKRRIRAMTSA
jgi:hypothetical protein